MEVQWVTRGHDRYSLERLARYYSNSLIPAEKKPYLTDLRAGAGPFMAVQTDASERRVIMDAASQIATLGLGFNPAPFFGVGHHLECWLNDHESADHLASRAALERFLRRKLAWGSLETYLCNSGAEANEAALGACFDGRVNADARRILAFEGSFHGRMLATLAATWSPSKRAPFEVPGYEAVFTDYPECDDDVMDRPLPAGWNALWGEAPAPRFEDRLAADTRLAALRAKDTLLEKEIQCLLKVRGHLASGKIFAIIIEPMQCEGGDRYSTGRFHGALLNMARAFRVPLVYDEVQTGFHLGRTFFWHQQFDLRDGAGKPIHPDYVVAAKKAQLGMVVSSRKLPYQEAFSAASMFRGLIQALVLDQSGSATDRLEKLSRAELAKLMKRFPKLVNRPRACGLSFAFEFLEKEKLDWFINERFNEGLLYYPAGDKTARFRLNLGFGKSEVAALFARVHALLSRMGGEEGAKKPPAAHRLGGGGAELLYSLHEPLIAEKLSGGKADRKRLDAALAGLSALLLGDAKKGSGLRIAALTPATYRKLRREIQGLQKRNYEPARQTPIELFDDAARDKGFVGVAVTTAKGKLVAISVSAPAARFPLVPGLRLDPRFSDPATYYTIDTTVDRDYQGHGLGRLMKFASTWIAMSRGAERMQGRNRDQLASAMLSINLSMGAYEQEYIREDYPDFEKSRDVLYYTTPLRWEKPRLDLSTGVDAPLDFTDLDPAFLHESLPSMVNKITLSNFVTEGFMESLAEVLQSVPPELRHAYTTSGLSECAEKAFKTIWFHRKPASRMLTFKGMYFGHGSFLARSLSGCGEGFFAVDRLDFPAAENWQMVLSEVKRRIEAGGFHSVWVEPLTQQEMRRVPREFLAGLRALCTQAKTPLVYNETAAKPYRYDLSSCFASGDESVAPDVGYAHLGGQVGIVFCRDTFFVKNPLTIISTWDGDEYSLHAYARGTRAIARDLAAYRETVSRFERALVETLSGVHRLRSEIRCGAGWFEGDVPASVARHFRTSPDGKRFIVCPSYGAMRRFLAERNGSGGGNHGKAV